MSEPTVPAGMSRLRAELARTLAHLPGGAEPQPLTGLAGGPEWRDRLTAALANMPSGERRTATFGSAEHAACASSTRTVRCV
jgi:hypothetical protein